MRAITINEVHKFQRGLDPKRAMGIVIYVIPRAEILIGHKAWADAKILDKYQYMIDCAMKPGKSIGYRKYIKFVVEAGHASGSASSVFGDWLKKEKENINIKEVEDALNDLWPTDEDAKERLMYQALRLGIK